MTKRNLFAEMTEGFDALAGARKSKNDAPHNKGNVKACGRDKCRGATCHSGKAQPVTPMPTLISPPSVGLLPMAQ
jgi:hypothetical protein